MQTREKLRLSPSSLSAFQDCRLKFKLQYIDHVSPKSGGNIYSCFGTAIHSAIGRFYHRGDFSNSNTLLESWDSIFRAEMLSRNPIHSPEDLLNFLHTGRTILETFYQRQKSEGFLIPPIFIEKKFSIEFDNFIAIGILDMIFKRNDEIEIVDFKTSSTAKSTKAIKKDHQLTLYSWIYWKTTSQLPNHLCLHYLKPDSKIYTSRTLEEIQAFETYLNEFYGTVKSLNEWIPNFEHCAWCDFHLNCPEYSKRKIYLV
jgi:RecB family exonuclease